MAQSDTPNVEEEMDVKRLPGKPPDKNQFEAKIEVVSNEIKEKELQLRNLGLKGEDDELKALQEKKSSIQTKKHQLEADLKLKTQEVQNKSREVTRIQPTLPYKNEHKIDDAVRKLEYQLNHSNFKLSEERKIVAEVDSLRRAKKALGTYMIQKKECDKLREEQAKIRNEKDRCFQQLRSLRSREDELKHKQYMEKNQIEDLRKEIKHLYEEKQRMVAEFKEAELEWSRNKQAWKQQQEEDRKQQRELSQVILAVESLEIHRDPYADEKLLCAALMSYLHGFVPNGDSMETEAFGSSVESTPVEEKEELVQSLQAEGLYVLKKKEDKDQDLLVGIKPKSGRKSRKDKRKTSQNKPLVHQPETLKQFGRLGIKPPTNQTEISNCLQQLQEKKIFFEQLATAPLECIDLDAGASGMSTCGSSSVLSEGGLTGSIPNTPDIQLDKPPFASEPVQHRRLSLDSGTCELESGQASCDDMPQDEQETVGRQESSSDSVSSEGTVVIDSEAKPSQPKNLPDVLVPTGPSWADKVKTPPQETAPNTASNVGCTGKLSDKKTSF